jgi:hypothetical protein
LVVKSNLTGLIFLRQQLRRPGKNLLDAMTVRTGLLLRHRIHDKGYVVAQIVGAARGRLYAATVKMVSHQPKRFACTWVVNSDADGEALALCERLADA